ncbi:fibronectin type III domain-containing protein [Amycolatopsis orientalis]|uniref:fibronectin type III domain-containing protein n=1 Tax=Amycolatopsis orientalis TaxID=31958 RepID=UPI0003AAE8F1|nr:fibronectin type III domain-containing protein [Amycolatopsis orientalis]
MPTIARTALAAALAATLAACGSAPPPAAPAFTATLTSPTNVVLHWPADPAAAGYLLEYANAADGPWTALQYLPRDQTSYTHPNLIPETPFYYRIRSFAGPVSATVTPGGAASPDTAVPPSAPGDFTAAPAPDQSLHFAWTDRTAGEAGFLLEIRRPGAPDFTPVEVTDPDATHCALSLLPGEQGSAFRIRALSYGPLSPVVERTTGKV